MRVADLVPACFEVESGEFDVEAVERFLGARRDVILSAFEKGDGEEPLVPMSKFPALVQRRWREYLEKSARKKGLDGGKTTGKISGRVVGLEGEEGSP